MSIQLKEFNRQEIDFLTANKKHPELHLSDVRRLELSDLDELENLIDDDDVRSVFGEVNCSELLDKASSSIGVEDTDGKITGFVCVTDHPNVPSVPSWEWNHWLYNIYHLALPRPRNTFWIHLAGWDKQYTYIFLRVLLKFIYASTTGLEYVIAVIPPGITKIDWLEDLGTRILPSGSSEAHKVQTLYLMVRQHFVTKYKIRRAVEEDNDDLVPLIHAHSERLQQHYGEFYVAEMITRHPDCGRQIIVAEYDQHAVSVLCMNESVNVDQLNEAFEMVPFHGLRKPDERDIIECLELDLQGSAIGLREAHEQGDDVSSITNIEPEQEIEKFRSDSIMDLYGTEEMEIATVRPTPSETSEDDFLIVDVSSIHLRIESLLERDLVSLAAREESDDYSAVILSFNDYEMHLFSEKRARNTFSTDDLQHYLPASGDGDDRDRSNHKNLYVPKIPTYHGELNAFSLELAASLPKHEFESLTLLLEAAFECYPDRDYCVLSIPSTCPPLPVLKQFIRVPPRRTSTYPHELYILHRNVVLSTMSVRAALPSDSAIVDEMVEQMVKTERFLEDFRAAIEEVDDRQAFLLLTEDQPIGVGVIREEKDYEYLKCHYELNKWIDEAHHKGGSHGLVLHLVLASTFQRLARFFLREMHRLSDYSVLYYRITPSDVTSVERDRSLCCGISDMVAVMPRLHPEYTQTNLEDWGPADVVYRKEPPFALYVSTPRHLTIPKHEINTRIVIAGSSDTAIAFLDSLLCGTNLTYKVTFNNVTIVSPHGLNYQRPDNRIRDMMFVTRNDFNYRYMNLTSLRTYVNVVNAVMTAIDRKNKLLIVNDGTYLAYDYLFLFCGEQFQKPNLANQKKNNEKQKKGGTEFPENVFLINTEIDATNALVKLKNLSWEQTKKDYTIIVYGNALETYCCIATLLEYGVKGGNITFVESFPIAAESPSAQHRVTHFNDADVDEAVLAATRREGITVHSSYYFLNWIYDPDTNKITSARFESHHSQINVRCIAMFMYNEKTVSTRTFMAINQAGLVFDGGLVIKPDCRTNDPYIYAAGTLTKYSRRYYADHMRHKYYNLEEIGRNLGKQMRQKFIPYCDEAVDEGLISCPLGSMLVPTYERPLVVYCRLPGNLRYLSVTKPGKPLPLEVAMSSDDYGQVLVTGDSKQIERQGFFRLHINSFGFIETITCLAQFDIDRKNLTSLWGKHEKLLNNLQLRFEMALITDLFQYFREPWTCVIFHDRFSELEGDIKELLTSFTEVQGESLVEDLLKMFKANDWSKLTLEQEETIEKKFTDSPYHKILEQKILDFLSDNDTFLPMYAHPNIVRFLLQGCENSPLFQPQ